MSPAEIFKVSTDAVNELVGELEKYPANLKWKLQNETKTKDATPVVIGQLFETQFKNWRVLVYVPANGEMCGGTMTDATSGVNAIFIPQTIAKRLYEESIRKILP